MIIYTFILILDSYLDRIRSYLIIFNGLQVNYSVKARLAQNTIHGGRMSFSRCMTSAATSESTDCINFTECSVDIARISKRTDSLLQEKKKYSGDKVSTTHDTRHSDKSKRQDEVIEAGGKNEGKTDIQHHN